MIKIYLLKNCPSVDTCSLYHSSSALLGLRGYFLVNMNTHLWWNKQWKSESPKNVNRLAEINAKMVSKFVSSTTAVDVDILLAKGDGGRRKDKGKCI